MGKKPKAGTSKAGAAQRRALFVEAYIANGGNATQAAIAAGYSEKSARRIGTRLSTNVHIKAAIETRRVLVLAKVEAACEVTVEKTLRELARIAYFDPARMFDADGKMKRVQDMDVDTRAALTAIEVDEIVAGPKGEGLVVGHTRKVKVADKNSALEKAMKHLGLFEADNKQKPPLTVAVGVLTVPRPDEEHFQKLRRRFLPQK